MPSPLVSIGLPAFNCEKTLAVMIRSILNQTYGNWELLLIEDGSSDRTLEVAQEFSDPRISVFTDRSHKGLVSRLNQAVAMGRGKYFARMDADDVAYPERLERQVEYQEEHPEIDLLGCGMLVFKGDGVAVGATSHAGNSRRNLPASLGRLLHRTSHLDGTNGVVPRASLRRQSHSCGRPSVTSSKLLDQPFCLPFRSTLRIPRGAAGSSAKFCAAGTHLRQRHSRNLSNTKLISLAIAAVLRHFGKAFLDILAIATGLNYLFLAHRARPLDPASLQSWARFGLR